MWTLDFETQAIDGHRPPEPVGLAWRDPEGRTGYYSWGHPDSTDRERNLSLAKTLYDYCSATPTLYHNAKFDTGVAEYHWGIRAQSPLDVHDTLYLLFLNDPYSPNLSLKPSAERLLGWAAEERDELHEWILANVPEASSKTAGAYIARASSELVGRYAVGDVERTYALYMHLSQSVFARGMRDAYVREQRLMPIFYEAEQRGVRIDREQLAQDLVTFEHTLVTVETDLRSRLRAPDLDFGKKDQLADALDSAGYVDDWILTPTGKRSTSKENLERVINDDQMLHLLRYRGGLAGVLQTFARPWLEDSAADGRLHTQWNQVRTHVTGDSKGTRTGRLSASRPNLTNVPNEYEGVVIPAGYPPLPVMRRYMLPEEGCVWLKRDFSGQEVRWLSHFEDGILLEAYRGDSNLDPHRAIQGTIARITGTEYERKAIKRVVFGIIYGQGDHSLSLQLKQPIDDIRAIRAAIYQGYPAIAKLQRSVSGRGRKGGHITTWGGRQYYAEPKKIVKGRIRDFSYKLLNYLIQGSAADQTKDSIIVWNEECIEGDTFLAAVHDEINISAPVTDWEEPMVILRHCMDEKRGDCPMESEGFTGPNWAQLTPCE